jgi:hypothetical protein
MKRLIVGCTLLFGLFSSLVTGCGSRSADDLYLRGETAGNSGLGGFDSSLSGSTASAGETIGVGGVSSGGSNAIGGHAGEVAFGGSSGAFQAGGATALAGSGGASAGGAAQGGATGIAGSSPGGVSGSPSSGGAAAGGASAGAAGASAGAAGASAGAGGGNSASCPASVPLNNGMCNDATLTCSYVGERCRCRQQGNALSWRCTGSGDACPSTQPKVATACTSNLQCPYPNGDQCNCQNGAWTCFTPGCPATKPTPSASCGGLGGQQCTYGAAGACVCIANAWFCN